MTGRQWCAGRYQAERLLGRGGTAEVWQAVDRRLHRRVAVKAFAAGLMPGAADDVARFRAEVRVLVRLDHPHVIRVLDAGVSDQPWYVMHLADGGNLARPGRAGIAGLGQVAAQVADALAYLHGRGIVHRDVKPSNILLDGDGRAYLSDFGVAQIAGATRITATGLLVGTVAYLSPEQVRGEEVGPPADVYALGLVLLERLTGRREYTGPPAEAAIARLVRRPAVPVTLPAGWFGLLTAMTAFDPGARPAAAEVVARLAERGPDLGPRLAPAGPGAAPDGRGRPLPPGVDVGSPPLVTASGTDPGVGSRVGRGIRPGTGSGAGPTTGSGAGASSGSGRRTRRRLVTAVLGVTASAGGLVAVLTAGTAWAPVTAGRDDRSLPAVTDRSGLPEAAPPAPGTRAGEQESTAAAEPDSGGSAAAPSTASAVPSASSSASSAPSVDPASRLPRPASGPAEQRADAAPSEVTTPESEADTEAATEVIADAAAEAGSPGSPPFGRGHPWGDDRDDPSGDGPGRSGPARDAGRGHGPPERANAGRDGGGDHGPEDSGDSGDSEGTRSELAGARSGERRGG